MPAQAIPEEITQWLDAHDVVSPDKVGLLFEALYADLRRRARGALRNAHGSTLNTTGLVNEAYLRLVKADTIEVRSRQHFLALASKTMRWVILDTARARLRHRRGGHAQRIPFEDALFMSEDRAEELVNLDSALGRLSEIDPRLGNVVELRFFGGLSIDDIASTLAVSPRTVKRDWRKARAFLAREIAHETELIG